MEAHTPLISVLLTVGITRLPQSVRGCLVSLTDSLFWFLTLYDLQLSRTMDQKLFVSDLVFLSEATVC